MRVLPQKLELLTKRTVYEVTLSSNLLVTRVFVSGTSTMLRLSS